MALRGKNRLRLQKITIGLYEVGDIHFVPFFIDAVIGSNDEMTDIDISGLPQDYMIGAIYVNLDDHAYAKVRFDRQSIDWFT